MKELIAIKYNNLINHNLIMIKKYSSIIILAGKIRFGTQFNYILKHCNTNFILWDIQNNIQAHLKLILMQKNITFYLTSN